MSEVTVQTLFVGIGSPHGDDQIGWRVADALADPHPQRSTPLSFLNLAIRRFAGVRRTLWFSACSRERGTRIEWIGRIFADDS